MYMRTIEYVWTERILKNLSAFGKEILKWTWHFTIYCILFGKLIQGRSKVLEKTKTNLHITVLTYTP